MQAMLPTGTSEIAQVNDWHRAIGTFSGSVAPMPINPPGNSVPPAVVALLNEVVRSLTHFDYRNRPNRLEWVRTKIWSAIRTLENSNFARKRLDEMRQVRAIRLEKLRLAELRRRKVSHYGG
jgi:hypothetical protein